MEGLLSGTQINQKLLDPASKEAWISCFERTAFDQLPDQKGIGILPFASSNLGPVSYDLTVGDQAYSLRRGVKQKLNETEDTITIDPGETVLILTAEYVALSPRFASITLSRARIMNEGIALSSAKIDPTWHGRLVIPITNTSRSEFKLRRGTRFCTILFFELGSPIDPAQYLNRENTPHLGQNTFEYEPRHATTWQPKRAETVCTQDMDSAVAFGPPFDIVRGMFDHSQRRIVDYMEKQWGTKALRDLKHSVWDEEFRQIKAYREIEIKLLKDQVEVLKTQGRHQLALIITLVVAVLGWIAIAVVQIVKAANAG